MSDTLSFLKQKLKKSRLVRRLYIALRLSDEERRQAEKRASALTDQSDEARDQAYLEVIARKKKEEDKEERYLALLTELTGWDRETAGEAMREAQKRTGVSFEQYVVYRFYELDEKTQKTYFTKRDSSRLTRKYRPSPGALDDFRKKSSCYERLSPYLGRIWLKTGGLTREALEEAFGGQRFLYKPDGSSGGNGITVFDLAAESPAQVLRKLRSLPEGVVEGFLTQHPEMKKVSPHAVNTLRIVTVMTRDPAHGIETDKVHFLYATLRMACGESVVDNLHSHGLAADVDLESGECVTDAVDYDGRVYPVHPDTGEPIRGFGVPCFREALALVQRAGSDIEGYLGWDVAVTDQGPVIIEVNISPGADGLQLAYVPVKKGQKYRVKAYL